MMKSVGSLMLGVTLLSGCGVDRDAPEYDQRRFDELKKARCGEMAGLLSSQIVSKGRQSYDRAFNRCETLKQLTFEEYQRYTEYARESDDWDVYSVYPEREPSAQKGSEAEE